MNKNFNFSKNGLDLLRYWSAISVMLLHYTWYSVTYNPSTEKSMTIVREIASFFPGVIVLFAMSGYLIAASYERSKNLKEFYVKRVIRMYPELWMCTLINFGVIIILVPNLLDKSIVLWIITQIFGIANTPICLNSFATGSVNGALWTIFTEIQFYIVIGLIYKGLKRFSTKTWMVFLFILAVANVFCDFISRYYGGIVSKLIERCFVPYAIWFFIGVFCYEKKEEVIPKLKKMLSLLLIIYTIQKIYPARIPGYYANIATGILCPMIVIGLGYSLPKVRMKCDLTYGLFLYHWIVLNVMIHLGILSSIHWSLGVCLFVSVTTLLAWVSWKYIGKTSRKMVAKLLSI